MLSSRHVSFCSESDQIAALRQAKKGRAAWTFGSKERKEFAEFYAAEASWPHRGKRSTQAAGPAASPAEFFVMRGNHEPANICLG